MSVSNERVNSGQPSWVICQAAGWPVPGITVTSNSTETRNVIGASEIVYTKTVIVQMASVIKNTSLTCMANNTEGVDQIARTADVYRKL